MNVLQVLEYKELQEGAEVEPASLDVGDVPAPLVQNHVVQENCLTMKQNILIQDFEII